MRTIIVSQFENEVDVNVSVKETIRMKENDYRMKILESHSVQPYKLKQMIDRLAKGYNPKKIRYYLYDDVGIEIDYDESLIS